MAGYSGTPLARKLGVAAGDRLGLLGAPVSGVSPPPGAWWTGRRTPAWR